MMCHDEETYNGNNPLNNLCGVMIRKLGVKQIEQLRLPKSKRLAPTSCLVMMKRQEFLILQVWKVEICIRKVILFASCYGATFLTMRHPCVTTGQVYIKFATHFV
jgi:hypothetical protein